MKFEFQMEQDEQMIHGKIEANNEEIATEMVKNGEYTDKDIISREPYNKHDSYFAIWSVQEVKNLRKAEDFLEELRSIELGIIKALSEAGEYEDNPNLNISQLKKRIKYCRNPLEKQSLQRELNNLYKKRKRGA